jgi:hypothetical protein
MSAIVQHNDPAMVWSSAQVIESGPDKGTPRARGFARAPGSPLACIR